jgi:hypothetical protein
MVENGRQPE